MNPTKKSQELDVDESADLFEQQLAELVSELTDRAQRGEQVDLEKVCQQHPQFAHELRYLWGTVLVTEAIGSRANWQEVAPNSDTSVWPPQLPFRMGDYQLLEHVGQGGMGIVFRAKQISLGREVAIKMIQRNRLNSPEDHQRFLAEAEIGRAHV